MKTGMLALGRQRLERLVILVDVRVFALQVCVMRCFIVLQLCKTSLHFLGSLKSNSFILRP